MIEGGVWTGGVCSGPPAEEHAGKSGCRSTCAYLGMRDAAVAASVGGAGWKRTTWRTEWKHRTSSREILKSPQVHGGSGGRGPSSDVLRKQRREFTKIQHQAWTKTPSQQKRSPPFPTGDLRAGVGAVVWHSPTVTSTTASASAAVSPAQVRPDIVKAEEETSVKSGKLPSWPWTTPPLLLFGSGAGDVTSGVGGAVRAESDVRLQQDK